MKLFRFPKRDLKRFEEDPPLLRLARYILIVLLFGAVFLGFWLSGQRREAMRTGAATTTDALVVCNYDASR